MALVDQDILQITPTITYAETVTQNVWHYRFDNTVLPIPPYSDIASRWHTEVYTPTVGVISTGVVLTNIQILNLTNGLDEFNSPVSDDGAVGGDPMPAFVAWAFRLNRATKLTRHGQKRLVGVPESLVAGNAPTAGALASLQAIADAWEAGITVTGVPTGSSLLSPVIVGRTPDVNGVYHLDLTKINTVASIEFTHVSTQSSRKFF